MNYYPSVQPSAYSYVRSHGRRRPRYDNYYSHGAPVQVVPSVVGCNSLCLILYTELFSSQTAWESTWLVLILSALFLTLSSSLAKPRGSHG